MTAWPRMVQMIATARDADEATGILEFCKTQVDFRAGRALPARNSDPWRVQALFEDCGHDLPLPDGLRRVIVPPSLLITMSTATTPKESPCP